MFCLCIYQATVKEGIWSSLEQDLVPSSPMAKSNWLELQSKLISKKSKESNVCVAGGTKMGRY